MIRKKLILLLLSALSPTLLLAQSVDQAINSVFEPITDVIESVIFFTVTLGGYTIPFVLIWLIAGALFFTIYMRFVNIMAFKHALDVVRGKYDNPNDQGEVSHFQALTAALSGTVGVGNIAGRGAGGVAGRTGGPRSG